MHIGVLQKEEKAKCRIVCVNSVKVVLDQLNLPVWHQSIILSTEHRADIGGMINTGIEVGVVPDFSWEVHPHLRLRNNGSAG